MISCSDAKNLINDYIDGLLNEKDCSSFEEHISCCENCHHEYDMMKSMVNDLDHSKASLPVDFTKKMHIALVNNQLKGNKEKKSKLFNLPYAKVSTITAAVIMIAAVGKFGVYDAYKDISNESILTETAVTEEKVDEITFTEDVPNTSPVTENKHENIKIVKVIEKTDGVSNDNIDTTKIISLPDESIPVVITEEVEESAVAEDIQVVSEEAPAPLALARMFTEDVIESEIVEETTASLSKAMESDKAITEIEEVAISNSTNDTVVEEPSEDVITDEVVAEKSVFLLTESNTPAPTIVEIQKSGEGHMLTIKNYLYTFLDGNEIAEADDQITITINADEYESIMKKISGNEYVKSISVGNVSNGKAIIIIK